MKKWYILFLCIILISLNQVYAECKNNEINLNGSCLDPINTVISAEKNLFRVNEINRVTISADNLLNVDLNIKLTLNIETGASLNGVISGSDCSGNQCTGVMILPAKSRKSISVDIKGESYGNVELKSIISSKTNGKDYLKQESISVIIINPGDGLCSVGETPRNACNDCGCPKDQDFYSYQCNKENSCEKVLNWFVHLSIRGAIAIILFLLSLVWYLIIRKAPNYFNKKAELYLSRENERKKVVSALYKIQNEIDLNNPPQLDYVIKKLNLEGDEDLIHGEYMALLDKLEEGRRKLADSNSVKTTGSSIDKLMKFVKAELELGYSKDDIIKRARWNNWNDSEIEKAFQEVGIIEAKRTPSINVKN